MRDDVSYTNNNNIPNWLAVHWQLILAEASNNLIYFLKRIWFDSVVCSAFSSIHPSDGESIAHISTSSFKDNLSKPRLFGGNTFDSTWRCQKVASTMCVCKRWRKTTFSMKVMFIFFLSIALARIHLHPCFFLFVYKMCSYKLTTMRFHIFAASATVVQTVEQPARSINFCGLLYSRLYITLAPSPGSHCHGEKRP